MMKARTHILASVLMLLAVALPAFAQRRITPVNNAATATQAVNETGRDSITRRNVIEMTDAKGNIVLVDTISGREYVDSTAIAQSSIPKMIYPLLHSASVSVDLMQPMMRAFGQHYGLIGFSGEINLHNRYIAVLEMGLGQASYKPDDNNYTYRSPVAPYFKIGADYNFVYNSNPDYLAVFGLRYGFTPFRFSIDDISQDNGYWDESLHYSIGSQSVTAGYLELLFGMRARIYGNFSLGWTLRYHSILHQTANLHGRPWYIPGYGSQGSALSVTFSLTYTLPLHCTEPAPVPDLGPETATDDGLLPPEQSVSETSVTDFAI